MLDFHEWHEGVIKKRKPTSMKRLWVVSIGFGMLCVMLAMLYIIFLSQEASGVESLNRSLAIAAVVAVGVSFALSGLCYFWDFVDTKIIYRKYIGIVGLDLALLHGGLSWFLYVSQKHTSPAYIYEHIWTVGSLHISNSTSAVFGIIALLILCIMFISSRSFIMPKLGGKHWREILRTGYVALFLTIFHFGIKQSFEWSRWTQTRELSSFPPASMLVMIFIIAVLTLRLTLFIALINHARIQKTGKTNIVR